jgi:hypothetical protein
MFPAGEKGLRQMTGARVGLATLDEEPTNALEYETRMGGIPLKELAISRLGLGALLTNVLPLRNAWQDTLSSQSGCDGYSPVSEEMGTARPFEPINQEG